MKKENEISKERLEQHFRRLLDSISYEEAIGEREDEETEMVPAQEIERVMDEEERGDCSSYKKNEEKESGGNR